MTFSHLGSFEWEQKVTEASSYSLLSLLSLWMKQRERERRRQREKRESVTKQERGKKKPFLLKAFERLYAPKCDRHAKGVLMRMAWMDITETWWTPCGSRPAGFSAMTADVISLTLAGSNTKTTTPPLQIETVLTENPRFPHLRLPPPSLAPSQPGKGYAPSSFSCLHKLPE